MQNRKLPNAVTHEPNLPQRCRPTRTRADIRNLRGQLRRRRSAVPKQLPKNMIQTATPRCKRLTSTPNCPSCNHAQKTKRHRPPLAEKAWSPVSYRTPRCKTALPTRRRESPGTAQCAVNAFACSKPGWLPKTNPLRPATSEPRSSLLTMNNLTCHCPAR